MISNNFPPGPTLQVGVMQWLSLISWHLFQNLNKIIILFPEKGA